MSDLPPPYSPPHVPLPDFNLPFAPLIQARRPARQAAVVLFVLAGIALVIATLSFLFSNIPFDELTSQQRAQLQTLVDQTGYSSKALFRTIGVMMLIPGLVLGALAIPVRRGRRWAIIATIVADALMLLFIALSLIGAVVNHEPGGLASMCAPLGLAILMAWLMSRLISALGSSKTAQAISTQFQAQPWFPNDGGYGYPGAGGLPPPPAEQKNAKS